MVCCHLRVEDVGHLEEYIRKASNSFLHRNGHVLQSWSVRYQHQTTKRSWWYEGLIRGKCPFVNSAWISLCDGREGEPKHGNQKYESLLNYFSSQSTETKVNCPILSRQMHSWFGEDGKRHTAKMSCPNSRREGRHEPHFQRKDKPVRLVHSDGTHQHQWRRTS